MSRKLTPGYVREYMNHLQLAEYLGVQPSTIRTWTRDNKLPFTRMGGLVRYSRRAIDAWMEEKKAARV